MTMFSRNGGTTLPRLPILSPDHNLSRFTRWWRRRRMPFGSACVFSDGPQQCCTGILMWRSYPAEEVGGMGGGPSSRTELPCEAFRPGSLLRNKRLHASNDCGSWHHGISWSVGDPTLNF